MWQPTDSRKGEDDHCWMKAIRCLSTPSEPPLRPSYWLFRVAILSLHISCSNIVGCIFIYSFPFEFDYIHFLYSLNCTYFHSFISPKHNLINLMSSSLHAFYLVPQTNIHSLFPNYMCNTWALFSCCEFCIINLTKINWFIAFVS